MDLSFLSIAMFMWSTLEFLECTVSWIACRFLIRRNTSLRWDSCFSEINFVQDEDHVWRSLTKVRRWCLSLSASRSWASCLSVIRTKSSNWLFILKISFSLCSFSAALLLALLTYSWYSTTKAMLNMKISFIMSEARFTAASSLRGFTFTLWPFWLYSSISFKLASDLWYAEKIHMLIS